MKRFFLTIAFAMFTGCSSPDGRFITIDPTNGISRYEAILIADEDTRNADFRNYFQAVKPLIREDEAARKYPNYWFVDYTPEVWMDFTSYLLVIDKQSGTIIRSREYYWPQRRADLDWVFESTEARQN